MRAWAPQAAVSAPRPHPDLLGPIGPFRCRRTGYLQRDEGGLDNGEYSRPSPRTGTGGTLADRALRDKRERRRGREAHPPFLASHAQRGPAANDGQLQLGAHPAGGARQTDTGRSGKGRERYGSGAASHPGPAAFAAHAASSICDSAAFTLDDSASSIRAIATFIRDDSAGAVSSGHCVDLGSGATTSDAAAPVGRTGK